MAEPRPGNGASAAPDRRREGAAPGGDGRLGAAREPGHAGPGEGPGLPAPHLSGRPGDRLYHAVAVRRLARARLRLPGRSLQPPSAPGRLIGRAPPTAARV